LVGSSPGERNTECIQPFTAQEGGKRHMSNSAVSSIGIGELSRIFLDIGQNRFCILELFIFRRDRQVEGICGDSCNWNQVVYCISGLPAGWAINGGRGQTEQDIASVCGLGEKIGGPDNT